MTVEHFEGTYEALSPITHGSDEDFGNEQQFRKQEMAVRDDNGGLHYEDVPVVSGNSLRGHLRDLLAKDFLDRLNTDDDPLELGDSLSNAFWAGGSLERTSGPGRLNRRMINGIRDHIPPLSLLGTALADQMLESRLNVGMLIPIAAETERYTDRESDQSVYEFVDDQFYTRQDDRVGGRQEGEDAQQMKYTVEALIPGTRFDHWLSLEGASEVERACLGHAMNLFDEGPHIGGQKAIGHGRVSFKYDDPLPDPDPYLEFVADNREEIQAFVEDLDEETR